MNQDSALTLIKKFYPDKWEELVAPYREIKSNYYPRSWLQACLYLASGGTKDERAIKKMRSLNRTGKKA